jgi:putative PIN family toxin of toxin-antitoxin system
VVRVVLDVNICISALLSRVGAPAALISAWRAGAFEIVVSPLLLAELTAVVSRPPHAERLQEAGSTLIDALRSGAVVHEGPPPERHVPGDPKDDYLVALARASGVHAIVTGDRHLLDLEGLTPPALEPRTFLALVEQPPG